MEERNIQENQEDMIENENKSKKDNGQRKHREVYLLLLLLLGISIGYSAISTALNIFGNTTVSPNSWDVHFENIKETTAVASNGEATLVGSETPVTKSTEVYFTANLSKPGDYYEFTVDVKNDGSIEAKINDIQKSPLDTNQQKYLTYEVTYWDGTAVALNDGIHGTKKTTIKVRVEFRSDVAAGDLPGSAVTVSHSYHLNYVQATGTVNYKENNS